MNLLLDPRNGPAFDLASSVGVQRTWVMASLPRTGSTLLCRSLWQTGSVGAPKEYLNPMQVRDWEVRLGTLGSKMRHLGLRGPGLALVGRLGWSDDRLRAHLHRVMDRRTSASGIFGMKIHYHHFEQWFLAADRDPLVWLREPAWVYLRRRDRVAQAVSWARALQTGRWASTQSSWLPPVYSHARIRRRLRAIEEGEARWTAWFDSVGVQPTELFYEDVVSDLRGAVREVCHGLGLDGVPGEWPDVGLRRQADEVSRAWCVRFRRDEGLPLLDTDG